jgi:flagellar motor switch/type III secretory pathway protein FliN
MGRVDARDLALAGSVRVSCAIHGSPCSIVVGFGRELTEKMDKLWRRQLHSSSRLDAADGLLRFELAQLAIPPQMLSEYLTKGTVIDLEERVGDTITLRLGHKPFMPARMIDVGGKLGCQIVSGATTNTIIPDGTSRLSIELASIPADAALVSELGQVGAIAVSDVAPGAPVALSINREKVGEARLCVYQGRHAVEVL